MAAFAALVMAADADLGADDTWDGLFEEEMGRSSSVAPAPASAGSESKKDNDAAVVVCLICKKGPDSCEKQVRSVIRYAYQRCPGHGVTVGIATPAFTLISNFTIQFIFWLLL